MSDKTRLAELAGLLEWYRDMGVDEVVGETAIDWLAQGDRTPGRDFEPMMASPAASMVRPAESAREPTTPPPPPLTRPSPSPAAQRRFPATTPDAAIMRARTAARDAATLQDLAAQLAGFEGCGLKATAKNLCFYRGAPRARVMFIGEAPGRDEDLEGRPFVGRAGQLLDRMLTAIALSEADVHVTNIVYWRPPGNRTPTPQEAQICRPFLERQVELVAPELVVLLGGAAAKHLLEVADGIMRIRGKWREIEIGRAKVRTIATLHPAYLLRTPAAKRLAWRDLLMIRTALDEARSRSSSASI